MDQSQQQMEELRRLMEQLESGGLLGSLDQGPVAMSAPVEEEQKVSPANAWKQTAYESQRRLQPSYLRANETVVGPANVLTDEQKYDPNFDPGPGYFWTNAYGWGYKGTGDTAKSSYINNQGQRVEYDNIDASSYWDPEKVNLNRQYLMAERAWLGGGEKYATDEYRYDRETNPYQRDYEAEADLDAQYEAALADYNAKIAAGADPAWLAKPQRAQHGEVYDDSGIFTDAYWAERANATDANPFGDMRPDDIGGTLRMLEDFNPFYARADHSMLRGDDPNSRYNKRREGNVMDWLYSKTKDNVGARKGVMDAFNNYVNEYGREGLYRTKMDKRIYEKMGLKDALGEYDGTGGGFADLSNPLDSMKKPSSSGGFLGSYVKAKEEQAAKPSVMSLFDEMKDYKDA